MSALPLLRAYDRIGARRFTRFALGVLLFTVLTSAAASAQAPPQGSKPSIQRRLPPAGIELDAKQQAWIEQLKMRLQSLQRQAQDIDHPNLPDARMLTKAVELAIAHNEFYQAKDLATADGLLDLAESRIQDLQRGKTPWATERGLLVRGYTSSIDGSAQPLGLEIPDSVDLNKPARLLVWLHGRGDKTTDLHFIQQRRTRAGRAQLPGAIVLHPFGRQCVGFKSAGEIDVLESIEFVCQQYKIDRERIVLMGFSMGGAGAWHLGAHYADHWAALSPGAGFAETRRYNRIADSALPKPVEQTMWNVYDVPNYVRNLFNIPVVAYSGENDKQIQAARVMEEAYEQYGRTLPHLIGPGMGHKYHPDTLANLLKRMAAAADDGRPQPQKVTFQTRTLRYSKLYWVQVLRLEQHWQDTQVDAEWVSPEKLVVRTENVRRIRFSAPNASAKTVGSVAVQIDGQRVDCPWASGSLELEKHEAEWKCARSPDTNPAKTAWEKAPGRQGPIDDAFVEPFLVVTPDVDESAVGVWATNEFHHFQRRWRALMRGDIRVKSASDVTDADLQKFHVVLWGSPATNVWIRRIMETKRLPFQWNDGQLQFAGQAWNQQHVPTMIYPNPLAPSRYVVLNSGLTFREGHDRTNSLQNPKLGDWAVFDIRQAPSDTVAGKVVATGIFDEFWQFSDAK